MRDDVIMGRTMLESLGKHEEIMSQELRCGGTMHGILSEDHKHLEVKCKTRKCGAWPGVVVIHTFDLSTGKLVKTERYSDPLRATSPRKG